MYTTLLSLVGLLVLLIVLSIYYINDDRPPGGDPGGSY